MNRTAQAAENPRNSGAGIKSAGRIRRELCADAAYRLLARQGLRSVYSLAAFDLRKIKLDGLAKLDTLERFNKRTGEMKSDEKLGYTVLFGGRRVILYDASAPGGLRRLNWTLAHEVGHTLLCHIKDSRLEQTEADAFAAELLAPEPAVRALDSLFGYPLAPQMLTAWFCISEAAAVRRRAELDRKPYAPTAAGNALLAALFPPRAFGFSEERGLPFPKIPNAAISF